MLSTSYAALMHRPLHYVGSGGVDRLVLARQSGTQSWGDLQKLFERTLSANSWIPGYHQLREWGIEPLNDEAGFPERWEHSGGARAVLYCVEGTYVLLVLGSLIARNLANDEASNAENNFVVNLYGEVLRAIRPKWVITGPFDRIVRDYEFGPRTYSDFVAAGVEYLIHQGGELEFGTGTTVAEWETLAVEATTVVRMIKGRLLEGAMSTVRENGWHMGTAAAPPGLTTVGDRTLVVNEDELPAVHEVVSMLADPAFSISEAAERLVDGSTPPRRRGEEGIRKRRGHEYATAKDAPNWRARKFVERVMLTLPDLAMGRHVSFRRTPLSMETVFVGSRRERTDSTFRHWLMWSVPDLFEEVDEDVLFEAVTASTAYRISRALPGSQYLAELAERERARQLLESGQDSREIRAIRRWAGPEARMLHTMGSAAPELHRAPLVKAAIAEAEGGRRAFREKQGSTNQRLFGKMPSWRQGDHEYHLASGVSNQGYAVIRREADLAVSPPVSLRRTWGIKKGLRAEDRLIANVPTESLHQEIAHAAVAAIEAGVPVLRSQHFATAGLADARRLDRLDRTRAKQQLENSLRAATHRAEAAMETAISLQQDRRMIERTAEEVQTAAAHSTGASVSIIDSSVITDAMIHSAQANAATAFAEAEDARQRLAKLRQVPTADGWHQPILDDMEIILETLVRIATRTVASPKECRVLQALFTRLEVESVTALEVRFSFDLILPGRRGDREHTVGPIIATVPTMGYRRPGDVSQPHAYAEAYCLRGELLEYSPRSRSGTVKDPHREAIRTIQRFFERDQSLSPGVTHDIVRHPLPIVREITFRLLTGLAVDAEALGGEGQSYIDLLRDTYLSGSTERRLPSVNVVAGVAGVTHRQEILDLLIARGHGGMSVPQIATAIAHTLPSKTDRSRENSTRARLRSLPERWDRPWTETGFATFAAIECPHCHVSSGPQFVDLVAWVPEVPGGLLCSRCLRSPRSDLVYPAVYRTLRQSNPPTEALTDAGTSRERVA